MPAKYDRCVRHVAAGYRKKGKSAKQAKKIGHATCTKMGLRGKKKKSK